MLQCIKKAELALLLQYIQRVICINTYSSVFVTKKILLSAKRGQQVPVFALEQRVEKEDKDQKRTRRPLSEIHSFTVHIETLVCQHLLVSFFIRHNYHLLLFHQQLGYYKLPSKLKP